MRQPRGMTGERQLWWPTYAALCAALLIVCLLPPVPKKHAQEHMPTQRVALQTRTFDKIRAFIAQNVLDADVEALLEEATITLRLAEDKLFAPGTDQLLPNGLTLLKRLEPLFIIEQQQTINIRGYTDDQAPPPGARFRDNWELSALRAAQLMRHLLTHGIEPGRLTATGFGDLEPLFPNTLEENRARNRRIEFVLERRLGKE